MLSDTISDAIEEIDRYQAECPHVYDRFRDHIELVRSVMDSLREVLDQPPCDFREWYDKVILADMTAERRVKWRIWCEAGLARWAGRLLQLTPEPEEGWIERVHAAVTREQARLRERESDEIEDTRHRFLASVHIGIMIGFEHPQGLSTLLAALASDAGIMPVDACDWLGLPAGSSYADGVKAVHDRCRGPEENAVGQSPCRTI